MSHDPTVIISPNFLTSTNPYIAALISHLNSHSLTLPAPPVPAPPRITIPLRSIPRSHSYAAGLHALTGDTPPVPTRPDPRPSRSLAYLQGAHRPTPTE